MFFFKQKKKSTSQSVNQNQQKLRKKQQKEESRELKAAINETNKTIKARNKHIVRDTKKRRRELGRQISFAPMEELIPIKRSINRGYDGFEYCGNLGFFDIVQVVSFDYSAMDDDDLEKNKINWDKFYRTTAASIKRISLNMLVDTTQLVIYYRKLLSRTKNPLYREKIKKEIEELRTHFENRQIRDYYLMYFADSIEKLDDIRTHITASLEDRGLVIRLSGIKKQQLLNKFSMPYSYKEMLVDEAVGI